MTESNRWLGVEVRHLMALEAVVAECSFAGAARRLGYTQSAISVQIAALERIAATRLLHRPGGRRPVVPTPAGERVLRHARRVRDQLQAAEADLSALASGEAGTVSLGSFQSASRRLLPDALRRLRASHPAIQVRLDETPHSHQLERLAAGQTDLALVLLPVDGPFEIRELLHDQFLFLSARGSRPLRLPSLAEIARMPLVSWQLGPFALETVLQSRGYDPDVVLRSDDSSTVQGLVAAGLGAAAMPRLALELPDPRLALADATRHLPPRHIGLVWHRDRPRSAAARAVIDAIQARVLDSQPRSPSGPAIAQSLGRSSGSATPERCWW